MQSWFAARWSQFLESKQSAEFFGNSLASYAAALGTFVLSYLLLRQVHKLMLQIFSGHQKGLRLGNMREIASLLLTKTGRFFILAVALKVASFQLTLTPQALRVISILVAGAFFIQVGIWAEALVHRVVDRWMQSSSNTTLTNTLSVLVHFAVRICVWLLVILVFLDSVGVNVTALVAGFGIGGVAVALAVQNILGDLLCSLSIVMDNLIRVGDSIVLGNVRGTVEQIGVKSTRIRSLSGELIIVPNSDLVKGQIQNYKQMQERRIAFTVAVSYQNSLELVREVPQIIKDIVGRQSKVKFERCHLMTLGESALLFECVYFVLSPDYLEFANIQQNINLEILNAFAAKKLALAYPGPAFFMRNALQREGFSL